MTLKCVVKHNSGDWPFVMSQRAEAPPHLLNMEGATEHHL